MTKVTDVRVYRWWPDTLGWTRLQEWACTVVGTASLTCRPLEIPRRLESWVPIPPPIPLGLLAERSGTSLASKTFTSAQAVITLSTNKELLQWNLDLGVFFCFAHCIRWGITCPAPYPHDLIPGPIKWCRSIGAERQITGEIIFPLWFLISVLSEHQYWWPSVRSSVKVNLFTFSNVIFGIGFKITLWPGQLWLVLRNGVLYVRSLKN